jgi:hypothetical protein
MHMLHRLSQTGDGHHCEPAGVLLTVLQVHAHVGTQHKRLLCSNSHVIEGALQAKENTAGHPRGCSSGAATKCRRRDGSHGSHHHPRWQPQQRVPLSSIDMHTYVHP